MMTKAPTKPNICGAKNVVLSEEARPKTRAADHARFSPWNWPATARTARTMMAAATAPHTVAYRSRSFQPEATLTNAADANRPDQAW